MAQQYSNPMGQRPVWVSETASVAAADYTPSTGKFRALNCSVAGLLTITKGDNTDVPEYMNTGWNPTSGKAVKTANAAATLIAAAVDL